MIRLEVNGRKRPFAGPPFTRLIDVLREALALTGTKEGCGEGECGACTVLLEGEPVNSCLVPVFQADGKKVETVEALGALDRLSAIQESFVTHGGAQCGICTPGMLMTAWAYVKEGGRDDPESVKAALAGNLCRCTGYQHIVEAVIEVVRTKTRTKRQGASGPGRLRRTSASLAGARRAKAGGPDPRGSRQPERSGKREATSRGGGAPRQSKKKRATRALEPSAGAERGARSGKAEPRGGARRQKKRRSAGGPGGPDPRERERATRAPKRRSRTK